MGQSSWLYHSRESLNARHAPHISCRHRGALGGTGFPRVFYLAYHLYRNYFPLLALTDYRRAMERA